MMTIETKEKQAVVDETKASATLDAKVDGAQDDGDIETLLAEFDQKVTVPASPPETKTETKIPDAPPAWYVQAEQRALKEEIKKVTDEVFDGLELSERTKLGWIEQYARDYPAVSTAFLNRHKDPRSWNRLTKALKQEALKDHPYAKKVDADATADRDAVAAAVRGASTKVTAEPPPDFGQMTDREFSEYTRKNFKF